MRRTRLIALALFINLSLPATAAAHNHATGHHGFDAEDDNERTREVIRRTLDFIRAHG